VNGWASHLVLRQCVIARPGPKLFSRADRGNLIKLVAVNFDHGATDVE
jgi:hypothetical protein